MGWKRVAWAGCLIPALGGCHVACHTTQGLVTDKLAAHTQKAIDHEIRKSAREAWREVRCQYARRAFTAEFRDGFLDGYSDYLDRGGDAQPPAVPPVRYTRHHKYFTPEGHALIRDYFLGFKYGVDVAIATGRRQYLTVPVLLSGPDAHPHGPPAGPFPPAVGEEAFGPGVRNGHGGSPSQPLSQPRAIAPPSAAPSPQSDATRWPAPESPPAGSTPRPGAVSFDPIPPAHRGWNQPGDSPLPKPLVAPKGHPQESKATSPPKDSPVAAPAPDVNLQAPLPPIPTIPEPDLGDVVAPKERTGADTLPVPPITVPLLPADTPPPPIFDELPIIPPIHTAPPPLPASHPDPVRK